jgi:hypothetical protein
VSPEGACAAYYSYGRYTLMRQAAAPVQAGPA